MRVYFAGYWALDVCFVSPSLREFHVHESSEIMSLLELQNFHETAYDLFE